MRIGPLGMAILDELLGAVPQFDPHRSARGNDSAAQPDDEPGCTTDQLAYAIYGHARLNVDDWQRQQSQARSRVSTAGRRLADQGLIHIENRSAFDYSPSGDRRRLERWFFLTERGREVAVRAVAGRQPAT